MAANESTELLQILRDIEKRSREHSADALSGEEQQDIWEAVLFSVAGERVATSLKEVREILNLPSIITSVPGAKGWVRGIANVRGNLLPVIDLQAFLGGNKIVAGWRTRMLVINFEGLFAGLMVDDVLGMRHFPVNSFSGIDAPDTLIGQYIRGAYTADSEQWPVFSIQALVEDTGFQVAAA
jgi:twitching motility protein PilI